jgi:arsenate reductase
MCKDAHIVITMGCGDECPLVPGVERDDWPLDDPKGQPIESVRRIRDDIHGRVIELIKERNWA